MNRKLQAIVFVVSALVAVERFYQHPTRGRGLRALISVIQAGEAL